MNRVSLKNLRMDLGKSLSKVANLIEYINITQEIVSARKEIVLPFNLSTVLTLKEIRSYEVEYFCKLQKTGGAFIIVEHMLSFPQSKKWALLSVEMVNLLNFWLEALRKYIITHSPSWWTFCKGLLGFFSDICFKDLSVSNTVLKRSAEGLLDLSTSEKLSPEQRSEVVICLNQVCTHSSREIRIALQDNYAPYLVKLASYLAKCVHVPTQFAMLELLMRWLTGRHDRKNRETAAALWFPDTLYSEKTVDIFVERNFINFFKDARDFLNQHNSESDHIISVVCRKLTVGRVELISVSDKWESWLELCVSSGSLVAMVDVRRLHTLGLPPYVRDHLTLTADNAEHAIVYREALQIMLVIKTLTPPQLTCKESQQLLSEQVCEVNIWISSKCNFDAVDLALRKIFGDKYKCEENSRRRRPERIQSSDSNRLSASEDGTWFSHPIEDLRPRRSGYVVNKRASDWKSLSSTSTTSLVHLHEKLSAFPRLRYDKEPIGVCIPPDLSCVTEITEPDDITFAPTGKSRPCGFRRFVNRSKTSPSDNDEGPCSKKECLSPILNSAKGKSPNCLLSATIGAHETSIINETLEAIEFNLDEDVVNLLAQEAFVSAKEKDALLSSGINVSNRNVVRVKNPPKLKKDNAKLKKPVVISKSSSDDTSASFGNVVKEYKSHLPANKGDTILKVVKSTTTDESNTEAINETPLPFVKTKSADSKRYFKNVGETEVLNKTDDKGDSPKGFADNDIDDFFSRHVQENNNGGLNISPTIARINNETPSVTSDSFDKYLISNVDGYNHLQSITEFEEEQNIVDSADVLGCLNRIIDKVCEDLDKCSKYMKKDTKITSFKSPEKNVDTDSDFIPDTVSSTMNPLDKAQTTHLKLLCKKSKIKKAPVKKNARRNTNAPSPIKTTTDTATPGTKEVTETIDTKTASLEPPNKDVLQKKAPAKRKRKLYSPKDHDKQTGINISETEEDNSWPANANPQLYTPKTTATIYKDIEKERRDKKEELKTTRPTRKRGKARESPLSPRTMKNNEVFDKLIENHGNVSVKLVDFNPGSRDLTIYNYSSDFEVDYVIAKGVALQKSKGTATDRVDYSERKNSSPAEEEPVKKTVSKNNRAKQPAKPKKAKQLAKPTKAKQPAKQKKAVAKLLKEPIRDVRDEKMRAATENTLNTSFTINHVSEDTHDSDLEPLSKLVGRMEPISEVSIIEDANVTTDVEQKKKTKSRSKRLLSLNKDKNVTKTKYLNANEETSTLPSLIIERGKSNKRKKDRDSLDSLENMIQGEAFNTTQNLLSVDDHISYSPETQVIPIELVIHKKLDATNDDNIDLCNDHISERPKKVKDDIQELKQCQEAKGLVQKHTLFQRKTSKPKIPEIIDTDAESSERFVLTVGSSPKTGHGASNKEQPNKLVLKDKDVDLTSSIKDFFTQLYKEFNAPASGKKLDSSPQKLSDTSKENSETSPGNRAYETNLHENSQYTSQIESIDLSPPRCFNNIAKRTSPTKSATPLSPTVVLNRLDPDEVRKLSSPIVSISASSKNVLNNLQTKNKAEYQTMNKEMSFTKEIMTVPVRKSIISPIKDFDEMEPFEPTATSSQSMYRIHETAAKPLERKRQAPAVLVSPERTLKRKRQAPAVVVSPERTLESKRKALQNRRMTIVEVQSQTSSVPGTATELNQDPLKSYNERQSRSAYMECLQIVLEKLDTTLLDINHQTRLTMADLVDRMDRRLQELSKIMEVRLQETVEQCTRIMEEYVTQQNELNKEFKREAADIIRGDFQRQQVLLRENVQAVLDHLERTTQT